MERGPESCERPGILPACGNMLIETNRNFVYAKSDAGSASRTWRCADRPDFGERAQQGTRTRLKRSRGCSSWPSLAAL